MSLKIEKFAPNNFKSSINPQNHTFRKQKPKIKILEVPDKMIKFSEHCQTTKRFAVSFEVPRKKIFITTTKYSDADRPNHSPN